VKFIADTSLMDELVDWFGKDFRIMEDGQGKMTVTLKCNEQAMRYWALQYGECIEIKEPDRLRQVVKASIRKMADTYGI